MANTREQGQFELLAEPFPRDIIKWRAQSLTRDNTKALALAYIDSRDLMDRLDEVIGPPYWADRYKELPSGKLACGIGIICDGEWVWKWDGTGADDDPGDKGMFTNAFKRAAVKWGLARYLYFMPTPWVLCDTYKGGDGKIRFSKFTEDPWDYVDGAPSKTSEASAQKQRSPYDHSSEPSSMNSPLGFGRKFKDTPIKDVPDHYLQYMVRECKEGHWKNLAQEVLDVRKGSPKGSPKVPPPEIKLVVPELKVFKEHMKPNVWMALLQDRYKTDSPTAKDQEDLLAYLQAEHNTRGPYTKDQELGTEVIKALYPGQAYRTILPDEMEALGPILRAHAKIKTARDSISGARLIITGWESQNGRSIHAALLGELEEVLTAINGQADDDIPF